MQAFVGYKAGMTHVLREVNRPRSRLHKKEAVEAVTIVETPPVIAIGLIGYKETAHGKQPVATAWAGFVDEAVKRRYYKNYYKVKKATKASSGTKVVRAFSSLKKKVDGGEMEQRVEKIKNESDFVRLIVATQPKLVDLGAKKAEVLEVQINGGTIAAKVEFGRSKFEQQVRVSDVFQTGENVDLVSVGKGRGWEGVIHRFGAKLLQKKTHRGRRKVACIGPWNPRRVSWAVARAGNNGFRKRTEIGKRLYRVFTRGPGDGLDGCVGGGSTPEDLTQKTINPMGGFVRYGLVLNDFLMIKGSVCGAVKRIITIRKPINTNRRRIATEDINLRWIDTASKFGHGRFQTPEERRRFIGKLKIGKKAAEAQ